MDGGIYAVPVAVLLSLLSALGYGVADFLGGIFAKTISPWKVAAVGQSSSTLCVALLAPFVAGAAITQDFAWGAAAGVGSGMGALFLYRGLANGKMSVVAPISAVGCALLPVIAGFVLGERPSALALVGIVVAFPAIWLISLAVDNDPTHRGGIVDGVLAGISFGFMFIGLGQVGHDAGLWPLVAMYAASATSVTVVAFAKGEAPLPTKVTHLRPAMMGPIGSAAVLAFWFATHHGLLSIVAVITALYPAMTVVLAAVTLKERILRHQLFGLALAAVAVACVAAG